jgi:GntR family transcriptional regulator
VLLAAGRSKTACSKTSTEQIRSEIPCAQGNTGLFYVDLVTVDHGSPEPAYRQLTAILRGRIAAGEWRTGPLPSVRELQETYGVGRDTVLRALDVLRAEDAVFTVPRRGTYVTRHEQP